MKRVIQELELVGQTPIQNVCADIQYQDIEYCLANRGKSVFYDEHRKIDHITALHETANLDWTYLKNGISFINNKTQDSLFFRRTKINSWYVQTAAHDGNGSFWTCFIDSESVASLLYLFFEESAWFSAVGWHLEPDLFEEYEK